MVETRCPLRFAAEALDELVVGRVPVVQELERDASTELLVLGQVDVRHPARAQLALDHVAAVGRPAGQGIPGGHTDPAYSFPAPGRLCSLRCFAVGAGTGPPKPVNWVSTPTPPPTA